MTKPESYRAASAIWTCRGFAPFRTLSCAHVLAFLLSFPTFATTIPLVGPEASSTCRVGLEAPGIGVDWIAPEYDDTSWTAGTYGEPCAASEEGPPDHPSVTADSARSVLIRTSFHVEDTAPLSKLFLGCEGDGDLVAWINGVEIFRSASRSGSLEWNSILQPHTSVASPSGSCTPRDVSTAGLAALRTGRNLLTVGVWSAGPHSGGQAPAPALTAAGSSSVTRGPYLQSGTDESIVVRWRTDLPTESVVYYGSQPGELGSVAQDLEPATEHEVPLSGLSPSSLYFYAIADASQVLAGDDADHYFVTAPPAGTARPTRIWVLGDSGTGDIHARAVRDAYYAATGTGHTDLWLMLGDNAYPNGTDADYQAKLFDIYPRMLRTSVLWPTLGNHDGFSADSSTQTGPYFDNFTLPTDGEAGGYPSGTEAYYSFEFGNLHFVVLDSFESDRSPGSAMLDWLELDLAATSRDWIVAFWHHPPYSKGSHDSDTEVELVDMREHVAPILEDYGVDLVLCGHSHSYERSLFLNGAYDTPTPDLAALLDAGNVVDAGDGRLDGSGAYRKETLGPSADRGAVYVVAGSSGSVSSTGSLDHPVMFVSLLLHGSVVLEADESRIDASFLDKTGVFADHFTLSKSGCLHEPPMDPDGDEACVGADNCPATPNPDQLDTDADGFGDSCDVCPDVADPPQTDGDGDGDGDVCDTCPADPDNDADGDGVCGDEDNCPAANPGQEDSDEDGLGDACDPCPLDAANDADGDGVCADEDNCPESPNPAQGDGDGDGTGDACDSCPFDPVDDTDGDGVCGDEDNCPGLPNPDQLDSDADGPGDLCDACPLDAANDADGDTVCAGSDNCATVANPDQTDSDGDSVGNACDPCPLDGDDDIDGDGICADSDNCPGNLNPDQSDSDGDGVGNACDSPDDLDGDGVADPLDNCPATVNPAQHDTDADGTGNACDPDDDDDSIVDNEDCAPTWPGVSSLPDPIGATLELDNSGTTTLRWDRAPQGQTSNVYRGFTAPGEPFSYDLVCFDPANPGLESQDGDALLSGGLFYYVVSARNSCGESILGRASSGAERPAAIGCPPIDQDYDGDGTADAADNCPLVPNSSAGDFDADFVGDHCDNCVTVHNPSQQDTDADGRGDACLGLVDGDDDGFEDELDNCPDHPNLEQDDLDGDGSGDVCDVCPMDHDDDLDADDVCGDVDNCPELPNNDQTDSDGDGRGNPCDPTVPIRGMVFEDVNYGGGDGRTPDAPGAVTRPGVRVELYDGVGLFLASTITDLTGRYSFEVPPDNPFVVRVASVSVTSSRGGSGILAVQTYRTEVIGGTASPITNQVGGEVPRKADAGNELTTLDALETATTTAQSITHLDVGPAGVDAVDFGFSFDVVVNTNDAGQGSLRQFLLNANALPNAGIAQQGRPPGIDNVIFMLADGTDRPGLNANYANQFAEGVATIAPLSALPAITDPAVVDATLQPGYVGAPLIELTGAGAGTNISGLLITAGGSTVRGLTINRFGNSAIYLQSGGGNTIAANYLGTDATGTAAEPNFFEGVAVDASSGNLIGGVAASERNVISGNRDRGVLLFNGSSHNLLSGNYIGTDVGGTSAVPNGIGVYLFYSPDNTIGGSTADAGNLISGNAQYGVYFFGSSSTRNLVQRNRIGLDASGAAALGNHAGGVQISGAPGNTVGGADAAAGNVIAGNGLSGVTVASGRANTIQSNSMYGNVGPAIRLGLVGSPSANDGLTDSGPNDGLDYPVFSDARLEGSTLHVEGYVGTLAQTIPGIHVIQVFKADDEPADQNGEIELGDGENVAHGEGRSLIGSCSTLPAGNFACDLVVLGSIALEVGDSITATATDADGNTSEFGPNREVEPLAP